MLYSYFSSLHGDWVAMHPRTKNTDNRQRSFRDLALVGGHPALDFVNTVKYRGAVDPQDKFDTIFDILLWARIAGLLSSQELSKVKELARKGGTNTRLLNQIRSFRDQVRVLFDESVIHTGDHSSAIASVEQAISRLRFVATIDKETGILVRSIPVFRPVDVFSRIVSCVADLLCRKENMLVKACGGSDCDWLFVDRTKAKRRQWCDTRTCGNLARVRKFRSQRKT